MPFYLHERTFMFQSPMAKAIERTKLCTIISIRRFAQATSPRMKYMNELRSQIFITLDSVHESQPCTHLCILRNKFNRAAMPSHFCSCQNAIALEVHYCKGFFVQSCKIVWIRLILAIKLALNYMNWATDEKFRDLQQKIILRQLIS